MNTCIQLLELMSLDELLKAIHNVQTEIFVKKKIITKMMSRDIMVGFDSFADFDEPINYQKGLVKELESLEKDILVQLERANHLEPMDYMNQWSKWTLEDGGFYWLRKKF